MIPWTDDIVESDSEKDRYEGSKEQTQQEGY
jgi:hypothetical protein